MGSKDEIESKPAHLILLTPYRFRLPRTEPIDFGEILRETSKYALTDKYYKTLDLATALRRDVYEILEYFALLPEAPPPVDNLVQLDETARRLYAAARPIMDAIDEYMPILCVLARLESDNHIAFRRDKYVEWTTAFPASQTFVDSDSASNRGNLRKGHSLRYELCHITFLRGVAEYTRAARGLYKLHQSGSATVAAQTWQNLRVSAGIIFHGCVTCAHDHNTHEGPDELGPETTGGVLSLLSALIVAQTQHVVYARAIESGNTPLQLERTCLDLIRAYDKVGNVLVNLTIGDNEEMKRLMTANDWFLSFSKALYLKNGTLLRARQSLFAAAEVWANTGLSTCRSRAHTRVLVCEETPKAYSSAMKNEKNQFTDYVADYKAINEKLKTNRKSMPNIRTMLMKSLNASSDKLSLVGLTASISSIVPYDAHVVEDHESNEYVDVFSGPVAFRRREYDEAHEKQLQEGGNASTDQSFDPNANDAMMSFRRRDSTGASYFSETETSGARWSATQVGRTQMLFERIRTTEEHGFEQKYSVNSVSTKDSLPLKDPAASTLPSKFDWHDEGVDINREQAGLALPIHKCGMCLQTFGSLGGSVTLKAINDKRHDWGVPVDTRKRANTATVMYTNTPVCVFCLQHFYPDDINENDEIGSFLRAREKSKDDIGTYMLRNTIKPPPRTSSANVINILRSPPTSLRHGMLSPVNRNLAQGSSLLTGNFNPPERVPEPFRHPPHYHSPSYPLKELNNSRLIPKRAIASHGWGLDGMVDDVFYSAALGYQDAEAVVSNCMTLEAYFSSHNELKSVKEIFQQLQQLNREFNLKDPHNLPRISLRAWLDMYNPSHKWHEAVVRGARHIVSIGESGALAVLKRLNNSVRHIDWVQMLTILKALVSPCTKCHPGRCTTFMYRPNAVGHNYCDCGHSISKHLPPTLVDSETQAEKLSLIFNPEEEEQLPSTWISPGRMARSRKTVAELKPTDSTVLEELVIGSKADIHTHVKHVKLADAQYERLRPIVQKITDDAAIEAMGSLNVSGMLRRRAISESLRKHATDKAERASPGHLRPSLPKKVKTPSRAVKIACGLCRYKFTLENLPCAATRGTMLGIRTSFTEQREARERSAFLKGKHVVVDENSNPLESKEKSSELYGRVVRVNALLGQVFVVHLNGCRAWYSVDDSWNWEIEDTSVVLGLDKSKSQNNVRVLFTKQEKPSLKGMNPQAKFLKERNESLKKYDQVRICLFCAQIYEAAFESAAAKQRADEEALHRRARFGSSVKKADMFAEFKKAESERKLLEHEDELAREVALQAKKDADIHEKRVQKISRTARNSQHDTDAAVEHLPTAEERRHAGIKRWEQKHNLKYFEISREERQHVDDLLEKAERNRITREAAVLNQTLDRVGLNLTTIPFSLEQLRAMTLKRRLRVVASIRIQALARGFIQRIRIVRYLGGEGASIEQGIEELREKIAQLKEVKGELVSAQELRAKKRAVINRR